MLWLCFIFVLLLGACVGSFLNVVIYRLPEGKSIVTPPSSCPHCGRRLAWYDNVPVLAWFYLRGRCRYCSASISFQYPLIEAVSAAVFGGYFVVCYVTDLRPDMSEAGPPGTWPVFMMHLALIAGLLAATVIDARYYIIPLSIPWTLSLGAVIVLPLATWWKVDAAGACSQLDGPWFGAALGGGLGLGVAVVLLWLGLLPRSFDEPEQAEQSDESGGDDSAGDPSPAADAAVDPDEWLAHPHPRREVLKECLFLAWPLVGAVIGHRMFEQVAAAGGPADVPLPLQVLGGVVMGYLVGGATVWAIRILGTLGFGKEAMGLGDVYLMAAVGAVCGGSTAFLAFFMAPFIGLSYVVVAFGLGRLLRREVRAIPYGPHLAAATLLAMIFYYKYLIGYFGILWADPVAASGAAA